MATGIEAASLVLALLPLLVNQIDNYIQGFQRMTCFKPKNYWREMESYRSILETERAILLNTLLIAVDGVTQYEFGDWTRDPGSAFWTSQDVRQKLRQELGSSYEPFTSTINVLSGQLKNLSQKLGLIVDGTGRIDSQTLEEIFAIMASSSEITGRETLPIVKRLRIAVDLACAVFQFDGSWLRRQWRARDIKVSQDSGDSTPKTYVEWDLNNEPRRLHDSQVPAGEPFIHLGFVLVELSQGKTLEALQTLEDHDQVQVVANRNTALRLLPLVEAHIGFGYRQVVDQCLNWPNCTVDNVDISKAYRSIIAPLVAYWRLFEGEKHSK
ncbi:hypothetical protein CBS76997_3616 [Aspergillus niger]|nr:hypothetical protein CBS133816_3741 [Aspergillus niger]KAI2897272.1 hypothetical protein CBS13152_3015 [Aspergillus niger]KAI2961270.1 hypothetical protein CBS147323_7704 [Aspergillus niger]KAI3020186.1 hypothetical protein CBS147347_8717 [Aspergillus niger]KAI3047513.1 hypothetical protein CBS76997_3616 [Aspergillus niger]